MRRLIMTVLRLLGWLEPGATGPGAPAERALRPGHGADNGRQGAAEAGGAGERLDAFRQTERQRLGEPVSASGVAWENETLHYEEDEVQTVEQERVLHTCDCGALIATYAASWQGFCAICGRSVCDRCKADCERCGAQICKDHAIKWGEHTFCSRHRPFFYWLWFWRLMDR